MYDIYHDIITITIYLADCMDYVVFLIYGQIIYLPKATLFPYQ